MIRVSERTLKHILSKHRDFTVLLGVSSIGELKRLIMDTVTNPSEAYADRHGVKYFLKKIDEHWINVVVAKDAVKTAYIIGLRTYRKLRGRRWLQRLY